MTPLEKALTALQEAVSAPKTDLSRGATIQRFEYSFELCWKFMKRYLIQQQGVKAHRIKQLFREAFDESDLPFTVDVVDWHRISPEC